MQARTAWLSVATAMAGIVLTMTTTRGSDTVASNVDAYGLVRPRQADFASQIQPILSARCMPCHFPGGSMHEQLPFDQPKTIHTLGEKLFTRIHDANEQRLIREFLAQR